MVTALAIHHQVFVAIWHEFQEIVIFQPVVAGCGLKHVMEHAAKKDCQRV